MIQQFPAIYFARKAEQLKDFTCMTFDYLKFESILSCSLIISLLVLLIIIEFGFRALLHFSYIEVIDKNRPF